MSNYLAEYENDETFEYEAEDNEKAIRIAKSSAPYHEGYGIGQHGWGERSIRLLSVSIVNADGEQATIY